VDASPSTRIRLTPDEDSLPRIVDGYHPGKIADYKWRLQPDLLDRVGQCDWPDHEQWLRGCTAPVDQLSHQGTRRDLLKHFVAENTSILPETYMSRDCPLLKVGVRFSTTSDRETEEDIIEDIFPFIDFRASTLSRWRPDA
jgi:hypothetical protein